MSDVTATITNFAYLETITQELETPLGSSTVEVPCDMLQAVVDSKPVLGHPIHFAPEAVGNRMAGYEIDDIVAAVESLVREVMFGWSPSMEPVDPSSPIDVNGGLDERIAVVWTEEASAQATEVLDPMAERIYAARDHYTPEAPDGDQ